MWESKDLLIGIVQDASDSKAYILLKNIRYVLIDLTLLTKA